MKALGFKVKKRPWDVEKETRTGEENEKKKSEEIEENKQVSQVRYNKFCGTKISLDYKAAPACILHKIQNAGYIVNGFVIHFDLSVCKLHSMHDSCTYGITA